MKAKATKAMREGRNSSFEILRIFAMLLIIMHHCIWYNNGMGQGAVLNKTIAQFLFTGGALGVDIFFMISGYFSVYQKFRIKRLIKLDLEIIFYSILFVVFSVVVCHSEMPKGSQWLYTLLPISYESYWFLSVYAVLCLFMPFFNKLINSLDEKHFGCMMLICFVVLSVVPALRINKIGSTENVFISAIYCYFLGAYLRKAPLKIIDNIHSSLAVFVLSYALLGIASIYGFNNGDIPDTYWKNMRDIFMAHGSMLMIVCSVSLIMLFKNIRIGVNKAHKPYIARDVGSLYNS